MMKMLIVVLALSTYTDANAGIAMTKRPVLMDDLVMVYPRPELARPELVQEYEWRRRYPEISRYAPYTPNYGWYPYDSGWRFRGTPNPYYREERGDLYRNFNDWGGRRRMCPGLYGPVPC